MHRGTRNATMGALLTLAMTACGGASDAGTDAAPVTFTATQVSQALPSKLAAPDGWKARQPEVVEGSRALEQCRDQGELTCSGVAAVGTTRYSAVSASESADSASVRFALIAYDTVDNAKVGMKEVLADEKDGEGSPKALTLDAGADETEAFTTEDSHKAILRIGTVVAYVGVRDGEQSDLEKFAKLQIDRAKIAASGKNPDA
ncbi:hypothetical protein ABZ532_10355 [Streptomyces sp. NPDC019396]|uniref:hypothetical protein n=1 Tax=Streptomyces sp. NPDC019396 TaxID=3154687 RepID=UPI0033D946BA